MKILKLNNKNITVYNDEPILNLNDFINLLIKIQSVCNSKYLVFDASKMTNEFFDQTSNLIKNFSQKLKINNVKMAIFGDFSKNDMKSLKKYIVNIKANENIFFAETKQEAIKILQEK